LRGDPLLWQALANATESHPWPPSTEQLQADFTRLFEQLTGFPLSHQAPIYLREYDQGGLSAGKVSPAYWREAVLPLLLARFAQAAAPI